MRDPAFADALAAVLASGVAHHDVQPANLLPAGTADYDTVVLLKSGILKLRARRDQVASGQTASASFGIDLGTSYSHVLYNHVLYDVVLEREDMASHAVGTLLATLRANPIQPFRRPGVPAA